MSIYSIKKLQSCYNITCKAYKDDRVQSLNRLDFLQSFTFSLQTIFDLLLGNSH